MLLLLLLLPRKNFTSFYTSVVRHHNVVLSVCGGGGHALDMEWLVVGGEGKLRLHPSFSRQEAGTASSPHTHIMRYPTHAKAHVPVAEVAAGVPQGHSLTSATGVSQFCIHSSSEDAVVVLTGVHLKFGT